MAFCIYTLRVMRAKHFDGTCHNFEVQFCFAVCGGFRICNVEGGRKTFYQKLPKSNDLFNIENLLLTPLSCFKR